MKISIELEIDELTWNNYSELGPEKKQQLIEQVSEMLKTTVNNERIAKLKKLVKELQDESGGTNFDAEILYEILRAEDE